ncbi:hypothetical protein ACFRNT_32640 [Streptomyces sp. NPDC056697]|uniref:hypothetical protein n=1 Tax=Streptomyces sp. NPDC056697 TaxID=3345915 RepID=UPI003691C7B7
MNTRTPHGPPRAPAAAWPASPASGAASQLPSAAVPTLGWEGRHHRVLAHIRWPHGDIDRAVTAFYAAVAALVRDAGTDRDLTDRATALHT